MQVKIFQAVGKDEIDRLQGQINSWLTEKIMYEGTVISTNTALCQVSDNPNGESSQHLVVTIWFNKP